MVNKRNNKKRTALFDLENYIDSIFNSQSKFNDFELKKWDNQLIINQKLINNFFIWKLITLGLFSLIMILLLLK